jgi:flagellin
VSAINITSSAGANSAIAAIDRALEQINSQRSNLGAISNRLDHTISNLGNVVINTEASQSRIEDADFAKVTGDLTKSQIMSQAATAMLAQANASKQGVLSLLQG